MNWSQWKNHVKRTWWKTDVFCSLVFTTFSRKNRLKRSDMSSGEYVGCGNLLLRLLIECKQICVAQNHTSWFSKHFPRLTECVWSEWICVIVGFDWSSCNTFHLSKCLFNCHNVSDYITAVIGIIWIEDLHKTVKVWHVKHRSAVITSCDCLSDSSQITWLMH